MATTLIVNKGETSSGITFSPTGTYSSATVYGTLENSIIDNSDAALIVQVSSGGVGRGISIVGAQKGQLIVRRYGNSYDTVVNNTSTGYEMVEGVASGTIVSKGYQWVRYNYSEAYGTIIRGGSQTVYGIAHNTTVSGGVQYVYASGSALDTVVSGGQLNLNQAESYASNTTIYGGTGRLVLNVNGARIDGNINIDVSKIDRDNTSSTTFINSLSRVLGYTPHGVTFTVTVAESGQRSGNYFYAGNLNNFSATVKTDTGKTIGTITAKQDSNGDWIHTEYGSYRFYNDTYVMLAVVGDRQLVELWSPDARVSAGTSLTDKGLDSGDQVFVYDGGKISDFGVTGTGIIRISSGGVGSNTEIIGNAKAQEIVYAGGISYATKIDNSGNAYQLVDGVASDAVVRAGSQWLRNGTTYNTTVSGGFQIVSTTVAKAYDTVLVGGEQLISAGAAVRTVLSNGKIQNGGGLVESAQLYGVAANRLYVSNGGVASATVLHDLSIVDVTGGRVVSTTLYDGTQELLRSNGVASGAVVSGGAQKVLSAGAVASNTVVYAGYQQVVAGASAWNTTIVAGSNGYVNLADGAVTGGSWNFDLSQGVQMDTAMLNAWRITDGTDLVITVDVDNMPTGKCYISSGASYFGDTTFTVKNIDGTVLASDFGDGSKFVIDDVVYKLALEGSGLYFTVITDPVELYHGSEIVQAGAVITDAKIVDGWSATVNDTGLLETPTIIKATQGKVLVSAGGEVAGATVAGQGIGTDIRVYGGGSAVDTYLADAAAYLRLSGGTGYDTTVVGGQLLMYAGGYASGATLYDGGTQKLMNPGASATKTAIFAGAWMQVGANLGQSSYVKGGEASDISVHSGGAVRVYSSATATGVKLLEDGAVGYVYSGGQIAFESVASGARINVRFSEATGNETALITGWGTVAAGAELGVKEVGGAGTFKIADSIDANITAVDYDEFDVFGGRVIAVGQNFSDVFEGLNYITTAADGTLTATALTVGTQAAAETLGDNNATTLADGNLATTWTAGTDLSTIPVVANAATGADAWLTLDGTTVNGALYGAEGNFANDVNLKFRDGSITNLAAGAKAGGSVANVNVMVGDINPDWTEVSHGTTFNGVAYAGGFGSVTGTAGTVLNDGTFKKDFYAGALANYAKTGLATQVGEVSMRIFGGKFSGNIFGASAVKAGAATSLVHSVGDVTLTIAGGESTKGTQACIFAGGYATGDATGDAKGTVYTVESVTLDVQSGDWGTACGGRGIFGGIMASGVTAEAGDVDITISIGSNKTAPTMGNVYGGGWAQKGGKSIVGNVNISIEGGEIANVLGGGSHSGTPGSGGTTEAGNVTITVSGGTITGAIYARGHLEGDTTGTAKVIFTGATDFGCGVYGYTYVGGADSDATLTFDGYTGTFSGAIGGFNAITLDGITNMTLGTAAADVSNTAWTFDVAERRAAFADTALLNWTAADFTGDTITLNLATGDTNEWSLVSAATDTAYNKFDVQVNGTSILSGTIGIDTAISGTAYDGWGFTNDEGTLKFKQLA